MSVSEVFVEVFVEEFVEVFVDVFVLECVFVSVDEVEWVFVSVCVTVDDVSEFVSVAGDCSVTVRVVFTAPDV